MKKCKICPLFNKLRGQPQYKNMIWQASIYGKLIKTEQRIWQVQKNTLILYRHQQNKTNMKTILITLFLAFAAIHGAVAQRQTTVSRPEVTAVASGEQVEQAPQFPGGQAALTSYLSKNLKYPDLASLYGVEGQVLMRFCVEVDGKISNITASKCQIERFNTTKFSQETEVRQKQLKEQFALLFAKEGARVIRKMPKWQPGTVDGKKVPMYFVLPITYKTLNK